jgi:hypothetical protein
LLKKIIVSNFNYYIEENLIDIANFDEFDLKPNEFEDLKMKLKPKFESLEFLLN